MSIEEITKRCNMVLTTCLDDAIQGRTDDLANRLELVTKATRYLETITPRLSIVRHIHEQQQSADPLAEP